MQDCQKRQKINDSHRGQSSNLQQKSNTNKSHQSKDSKKQNHLILKKKQRKYQLKRPEFLISKKRIKQREDRYSITSQCRSRKSKTALPIPIRIQLQEEIKSKTQSAEYLKQKYNLNIDSIKRYIIEVNTYGRILDSQILSALQQRQISLQQSIKQLVTKQPFLNQTQIKNMVQQTLGIIISQQAVSKILSQMSFTKKKRMNTNIEGDTQENKILREQYAKIYQYQFNEKELLFIDQIGFSQLIERQFGYAPRGEQLVRQKRNLKKEVVTLSVLMGYERLHSWVCIQGPPKEPDIASMIEKLDQSFKQWHLILDNARIHKSYELRQVCCRKKIKIVYLPPNSPELNPVQLLFQQLKYVYRGMKYPQLSSVEQMIKRTNQCCNKLLQQKFWNYKVQIIHWIEKALNKKTFFSTD